MNWKLQELCLRRIIEKFEIYANFYTSEDVELKRLFEFLLKGYSEEIISELYDRKQLQPMYIDILMNNYLTSLNTDWFQTDCWETISAKISAIGFTLKKLHLHRNTGRFPWRTVMCYLPNLETISFDEDYKSDEVLECVAEFCPNIVEIRDKNPCNFTIRGIKHLGMGEIGSVSCPKLKRLSIYGSFIGREGIEYALKHFPYLEDIDNWYLSTFLFERHQKDVLETHKTVSYNLTCLRIAEYPHLLTTSEYNDLLTVCFTVCPHLKELRCDIRTEEDLDTLSGLQCLTKLDLNCRHEHALNVDALLKHIGSTLKSLSLRWCTLLIQVLAESCPLLEEFKMHDIDFQTDNQGSIPEFLHLSSCLFDKIRNESIRQACALLSASHHLTSVVFYRCSLFSLEQQTELLKAFTHCPLRRIDFYRCRIGFDFTVKILKSCPNLSGLKLRMSFVGDPELRRDLSAMALTLPMKPFVHFVE